MNPLGVYKALRHRSWPRASLARAEDAAVEQVSPASMDYADSGEATLGPGLLDFVGVVAVVIVLGAAIWFAARWVRRAPTRGLRSAVRKAKRLNDRMVGIPQPHPAPEMEIRRRVEESSGGESAYGEPASRLVRRADPVRSPSDARAREALTRLAHILSEPDDKDIIADYVRLDTLVRRWLFDRYGVPAFSVSAATLLNSLPQELTDGIVDEAGEVLRVCEVAQLSAHRPSRREWRHLCGLAYELISGDDAASDAHDDSGREAD